ncbi:hypothetical protein AB6A40_009259 [Gnathostoma spinigerum]|uniref:Uncharacterized protein n=1 Tax=Gnathostoma spinigerum TaxID=75299 RepID=A0ABD6ERF6_9BILA
MSGEDVIEWRGLRSGSDVGRIECDVRRSSKVSSRLETRRYIRPPIYLYKQSRILFDASQYGQGEFDGNKTYIPVWTLCSLRLDDCHIGVLKSKGWSSPRNLQKITIIERKSPRFGDS